MSADNVQFQYCTSPSKSPDSSMFSLDRDILEDWLSILSEDNAKQVNQSSINQGLFKIGKFIEMIFLICESFDLNPEVQYLSAEIFDKFIVKHVQDLHEHVKKNNKTAAKDWPDVLLRVRNQILLRIVSCIQIASKVVSHYKIVTISKAARFLRQAGHSYSLNSVLTSELKVLKTLNYKISTISVLTYLETLLEILAYNDPVIPVKVLRTIGLKILKMVYLEREYIYQKLYTAVTGMDYVSSENETKFAYVQSDMMLLIVSVIAAASHIMNQMYTDSIIEKLEFITKIPRDDITEFAAVLISCIVA